MFQEGARVVVEMEFLEYDYNWDFNMKAVLEFGIR